MNEYKTDINTLCDKLLSDRTFHSPKIKWQLRRSLFSTMVAFWPEKRTTNFAQNCFTSQRKLGTGLIVKICQKSYACLRSRSDYILLTSAWGTQEEFADHQQNICNPQFCFLRPLEVLLARKNQNSKLDLPSPRKLQVLVGHYRLE